jgi:hypothetical protein
MIHHSPHAKVEVGLGLGSDFRNSDTFFKFIGDFELNYVLCKMWNKIYLRDGRMPLVSPFGVELIKDLRNEVKDANALGRTIAGVGVIGGLITAPITAPYLIVAGAATTVAAALTFGTVGLAPVVIGGVSNVFLAETFSKNEVLKEGLYLYLSERIVREIEIKNKKEKRREKIALQEIINRFLVG